MTHRRHVAAHCVSAVAIGLLLVALAHEWDARRAAEDQCLQLADVVNDMIGFQIEQVRAKTYRLEIVP